VGIAVTLTETSANSSKFLGTFTFGTTSSDPLDRIKAVNKDRIRVFYNDSHTEAGPSARPYATAYWNATATGTIVLDKATYYGSAAQAKITVTDTDLNVTGGVRIPWA
jgi:hypothetical protein